MPPSKPITIGKHEIKVVNLKEMKDYEFGSMVYGKSLEDIIHNEEKFYRKKARLESWLCTVIIINAISENTEPYAAAFALLNNTWKYLYNQWLRKFDKQIMPIGKVPAFKLTESKVADLTKIINLLEKEKRYQVSLTRWISSLQRSDKLDSILDCCSAIEPIINCKDEIRLRISIATKELLKPKSKQLAKHVYKMYGIRNNFIHGNGIPQISNEDVCKMIDVVAELLINIGYAGKLPTQEEIDQKVLLVLN